MTNYVVAGDYKGIIKRKGIMNVSLWIDENKFVASGKYYINKDTVESYEIIDSEEKLKMSSALIRGAAGAAIMGPLGALVGASSAKKKKDTVVSIHFKNGKKALVVLDNMYLDDLRTILY